MYHLVTWKKELGGAGITPQSGKWENVESVFPLHNVRANQALLLHLSKKIFLRVEDLDKIRDLFGSKVFRCSHDSVAWLMPNSAGCLLFRLFADLLGVFVLPCHYWISRVDVSAAVLSFLRPDYESVVHSLSGVLEATTN